ncbi:uncharacterized protein C6orf47 homolog [Aulostomus maculatus]
MSAVVGQAWGWVRSWGGGAGSKNTTAGIVENKTPSSTSGGSGGIRGWTSWIWGGWRRQRDQSSPAEEFWEAQEKLQAMEVEDLGAGKRETEARAEHVPRWWNRYLPTSYLPWPWKTQPGGVKQRKPHAWDRDVDGDFSDYGTPPPSPSPPSKLTSPFRLFMHSWNLEILPEHYEICFNFLRHLFDLLVVGFLWTVSPPTKLILEVLGVQGALKLWLHGMAMFFVSTVGMGGLLWLIQEYLPEFTLIYGIVQAMVISVSMKQSVFLGVEEEQQEEEEEEKRRESEEVKDRRSNKEHLGGATEKMKSS